MNRNTIIGLVLIFAIFIGWSYWMQPSEEELEAQKQEQLADQKSQQRTNDSIREVSRVEQQALAEERKAIEQVEVTPMDGSSAYQQMFLKYGAFAHSGEGTDDFITVEKCPCLIIISEKKRRRGNLF